MVILEWNFYSAASDVDPSTILGSGPTEPATMGQTTVGQAAMEQPMVLPTTTPTAEEIAEDPCREGADANAPSRDEGATATPPLSSRAEEENKAPSPTRVEEPPAAMEGALDIGKGPMMSSTMVGRSAEGEGAQADSDNEVEKIQGHPHDGRQPIYVWF